MGSLFSEFIGLVKNLGKDESNINPNFKKDNSMDLEIKSFSNRIVCCCKNIEKLIETLPDSNINEESQINELENLQKEKQEIDERLSKKTKNTGFFFWS